MLSLSAIVAITCAAAGLAHRKSFFSAFFALLFVVFALIRGSTLEDKLYFANLASLVTLPFVAHAATRIASKKLPHFFFRKPIFIYLLMIVSVWFVFYFNLTTTYVSYLLCCYILITTGIYLRSKSLFTLIVFGFNVIFLLATLSKFSVFFLFPAVYCIIRYGEKRHSVGAVLALGFLIYLGYQAFIEIAGYVNLYDFIDRRITRESYEAASTGKLFGVSDGGRFGMWSEYLSNQTLGTAFIGVGSLVPAGADVPPHNFIVALLRFSGVLGLVVFCAGLYCAVRQVVRSGAAVDFWLIIALIALSAVGEGVAQPFYVFVTAVVLGVSRIPGRALTGQHRLS
jgi:hypothetical protein